MSDIVERLRALHGRLSEGRPFWSPTPLRLGIREKRALRGPSAIVRMV
jgi:hypothetical protein